MALMPGKRNATMYPRDVDVKLVRSMISQGEVSDCNFRNGGIGTPRRSNPDRCGGLLGGGRSVRGVPVRDGAIDRPPRMRRGVFQGDAEVGGTLGPGNASGAGSATGFPNGMPTGLPESAWVSRRLQSLERLESWKQRIRPQSGIRLS